MCGIAGIIHFNGSTPDQGVLDRMTDALAHRGPDDRGTWMGDGIGLGHRRLSIIDLSGASHQPMCSADGRYVIVFNGEIYNFSEIRRTLETRGITFRSKGDTEVLLALYAFEGERCLDRLRGMFAFAVFDRQKRTLFFARDRVGKKPLHYFLSESALVFASEIKALRTHPDCPSEIDFEALHHFLTLSYLPSPLTGIKGLQSLPAAHCMTVHLDTGESTIRRYWSLTYLPDHTRSLDEWKERILTTLTESVRMRMTADVPVGAFLSGGIDSATIVALMSRLHTEPIRTFSIGSDDRTSELPDALRIAKLFSTDHHAFALEPDIVHLLPELVRTYEEPFGDPSCIPTYLVSRFTQKHVTVALSGDGGDECFCGYARYPILQFSETLHRFLPQFLLQALRKGTSLFHLLRQDTFSYRSAIFADSLLHPWPERILQYMGGYTDAEKASIYRNDFGKRFPATAPWFASQMSDARLHGDDLIHQAMNTDVESYLPDDLMPKVDMGAMAHGLEVRSPFLDHELLELTAELPTKLQLRGHETKWILRHLLRGLLPEETLHKPKQGFRLPLDRWFRGPLSPFLRDRLLTGHPLFWNIFDRKGIERFLEQYFTSHIDYSPQLWMLLWLREWFEQHASPSV